MIKYEDKFYKEIVNRGRNIYFSNKIDTIYKIKNNYLAFVEGTEEYSVKVVTDGHRFLYGRCSCPCEYNCKHMAAVLEYVNNEKIEELNISKLLDKFSKEELLSLIETLGMQSIENLSLITNEQMLLKPTLTNEIDSILYSLKSDLEDIEDKEVNYYRYDEDDEDISLDLDYIKSNLVDVLNRVDDNNKYIELVLKIVNDINRLDLDYTFDSEKIIDGLIINMKDRYNNSRDINVLINIFRIMSYRSYDNPSITTILLELIDNENYKALYEGLENTEFNVPYRVLYKLYKLMNKSDNEYLNKVVEQYNVSLEMLEFNLRLALENKRNDLFNSFIREPHKKEVDLILKYKYLYELKYGAKDIALQYIRELFIRAMDIEVFKDSLKLSTIDIEIEYYEKLKAYNALLIIYSYYNNLDKLMNIVMKLDDEVYYDKYYDLLASKYNNIYNAYYKFIILDRLEMANNRSRYKECARCLPKILNNNPSKELIKAMVNTINEKYSNKRALKEEFKLLFNYYENINK